MLQVRTLAQHCNGRVVGLLLGCRYRLEETPQHTPPNSSVLSRLVLGVGKYTSMPWGKPDLRQPVCLRPQAASLSQA